MARTSATARLVSAAHQPEASAFWTPLVKRAAPLASTPFYLFSVEPVRAALEELAPLERALPIPVRHWLSCKTQPVRPLLRWWRREGRGLEVVSEFELQAALREGYSPGQILVNGTAKQRWLQRYPLPGLRVNFDSLEEMDALSHLARCCRWAVGLRCHTRAELDPEHPSAPTQFGLDAQESAHALRRLKAAQLELDTVHFHLRTNVRTAAMYERALAEVMELCQQARTTPRHVDCGGGFPAPNVLDPAGRPLDAKFNLTDLAQRLARRLVHFPGVRELWFENGRFLTARSGVLVVRVLAQKRRGQWRYLICDGGRTTQALVSMWETHRVLTLPPRGGPCVPTVVFGPTCMAFDQLVRGLLPAGLRGGDHLLWLDAGAYHVPWETRFSHGHAAVVWHEGDTLALAREPESFEDWWGQWR
jgi:diaminopimelate decarboxylase